jgi:hypothetical protein
MKDENGYKVRVVKGAAAIVAARVAEAEYVQKSAVQSSVCRYIREKRRLARKLEEVRVRGAMYRALLTGDYTAKLTRIIAELERLGVTDMIGSVRTDDTRHGCTITGKLQGKVASVNVYGKRWGPECWVYVQRPATKDESWVHSDLALHIKFGSKNMIVQNRLLDIALKSKGD